MNTFEKKKVIFCDRQILNYWAEYKQTQ
jgi:hypothetical protein